MIEKIYTIPVSEAFEADCECPLCLLEKRFEEEKVAYYLGPSLMEPDHRVGTNRDGFCRRHFSRLYNKKANTLGLALIVETHLESVRKQIQALQKRDPKLKSGGKNGPALPEALDNLARRCCICEAMDFTMDRYVEVIFHLWKTEPDFRIRYGRKKGFCLPHLSVLLRDSLRRLGNREREEFLRVTMRMQQENLDRIQEEVHWFTQKFDYRYKDDPWGNSRDAVPRSIQKIAGYMDLDE